MTCNKRSNGDWINWPQWSGKIIKSKDEIAFKCNDCVVETCCRFSVPKFISFRIVLLGWWSKLGRYEKRRRANLTQIDLQALHIWRWLWSFLPRPIVWRARSHDKADRRPSTAHCALWCEAILSPSASRIRKVFIWKTRSGRWWCENVLPRCWREGLGWSAGMFR